MRAARSSGVKLEQLEVVPSRALVLPYLGLGLTVTVAQAQFRIPWIGRDLGSLPLGLQAVLTTSSALLGAAEAA